MAFFRKLYGEYTLVFMVLILGIGLSAWFAKQHQQNLDENTIAEFKIAAHDRIELINQKIQHNDMVLRSVSAFFRSSQSVSRAEFSTFTSQLLADYPYIRAIEWVPRVTDSERENFEKNADYPGFQFVEQNAQGEMVRAAIQDIYFPVYYVEPLQEKNKKFLGFNIASNPERYNALVHARETGKSAVSGRIYLLSEQETAAVIFFEPIISNAKDAQGHEYNYTASFIASVVPLAEMINAAIKPLNYTGVNIVISDLSAEPGKDNILYARPTRLKDIPQEEILADYKNPDVMAERSILDVGGREWQISVLAARGYFTLATDKLTYLIFASGSIFTLLLVFYMFSRIRENERITEEVSERTSELSKAKRAMEMILLSIHEGVIGLDPNSNITFCNITSSQLLGYNKKELIGQNYHTLFHHTHVDGTPYDIDTSPIQNILNYGQACSVSDEVFWKKTGDAMQVEYTGSPILEDGQVSGAVIVFRDVTERREMEKKLEQLARYDQLTNLPNRTLFIENLKGAIARAERSGRKVGVIYLDLNGFKPVNDTLGHAAGDRILKEFAASLKAIVRDSDTAARMGGDEFTILAGDLANTEECLQLVTRLKTRLETPFELAGQKFSIGASIGIAFYPDHASGHEDLISRADTAMYEAKKNKNQGPVIFAG